MSNEKQQSKSSNNYYPKFRDRSFSEGTGQQQQGIPLLDQQQQQPSAGHGHQHHQQQSSNEYNHGYYQEQQHFQPYASLMNLPTQQHYPHHYHPHQNGNDEKYIPMYPYPLQQPMIQQQQLQPAQPIIMNQVAPAAAALPTSHPQNIVVNANANGGAGGGGGIGGGDGRHVAAHALGGFECPFCHLGVVKKRRNPLIKIFIIVIACLTFPFGLLACILCWLPCAFQSQCSTCKKKI